MSENTVPTNDDKQHMLAQSERLAWLPIDLVERHAVRWALAEDRVALDTVPGYDPALDPWEQLRAFVAWADQHVMPLWHAEQTARAVPLACPPWCEGNHGELRGDLITPWDMSTTHEGVQLAPPAAKGLDIRLILLQNHPDEGPDGDVVLHVGGEIDLTTPAAVRTLAFALEDAADDLEAVQ
ncbi:MAG: hypothetical protein HY830_14090 [Actinobacteria bacterium]|nr:hypothetical protein [Actinomycetota bacterium]